MTTALLVSVGGLACGLVLYLVRRRHRVEAELHDLRPGSQSGEQSSLRPCRSFNEDLELEIARIDRTGRSACLVILSLDSGPCPEPPPETADAQRTRLAGVLDSALRVIDRRYRVGANEFALILPETRARAGLVAVRRIENAARDVGAGPVTAGLAEVGPGIDQRQLFRNAYCALLSAGREGRSTALVYSPELDRSGSRGATLQGLSEIEPV